MIYFWISIYLFKVYAGYYSFGHFSFRVDGLTLSDGLNKHFFVIKNVKTSNWKNIRLGLGLNIHVSTLKYIQDRCESNVSENEKTVPYFAKKRTFPNKMAIFQWKNMNKYNVAIFYENSISNVLKKLFSGLVMWQSDPIWSMVSIFDSIWKLNLKTSEFSRLLVWLRKRTKT